MGRNPLSVWCRLNWSPQFDVDTGGVGILDFGEGVLGTFYTSMDATWSSYFRVSGTQGILEAPVGFLGRERKAMLRLWQSEVVESILREPLPAYVIERGWPRDIVLEPANPYVLMIDDLGGLSRVSKRNRWTPTCALSTHAMLRISVIA